MNIGKRKFLFTVILFIILTLSLSYYYHKNGRTKLLLDLINERHKEITKPSEKEINYFITNYVNDTSFDIIMNSLDFDISDSKKRNMLNIEQAEADIDILFNILESSYGGYLFFGGNEVFDKTKENIIKDCSINGQISIDKFSDILINNFKFIQDNHFRINNKNSNKEHVPYFYSKIRFKKIEDQYYSIDDNKRVKSVLGYDNLDDLFQLSISDSGQFVYYPIVISKLAAEEIYIELEDGTTHILTPERNSKTELETDDDTIMVLEHIDGIPILKVDRMGFDQAEIDNVGYRMLEYADKLKDEPILIVDLRTNHGGNGLLPLKFLTTLSGDNKIVTNNYITLQQVSLCALLEDNKYNNYYIPYDEIIKYMGVEWLPDDKSIWGTIPDDFIERKNVLIILTSKDTSSAAESFIDASRNLENTIVIGENTSGSLVSGAGITFNLPESNIQIQFGSDFRIFPDHDFEEYVGYKPDFWVYGDAAEHAIEFIKYYMK